MANNPPLGGMGIAADLRTAHDELLSIEPKSPAILRVIWTVWPAVLHIEAMERWRTVYQGDLTSAWNEVSRLTEALTEAQEQNVQLRALAEKFAKMLDLATIISWDASMGEGKDFLDGILFAADAVQQNRTRGIDGEHWAYFWLLKQLGEEPCDD